MADAEKVWRDMTRREKLAVLSESLDGNERQAQVMAAVETYFRTHSMKDPLVAINVVSRESWRAEHGDTAEWDRNARAARAHMNDPSLLPDASDA